MNQFVKKNKEFLITFILIIIVVMIVLGKFFIEFNKERKTIKKDEITQPEVAEEGNYILKNGKLYITYNGIENIEVPGDFSNVNELKTDTFQISNNKIVFSNINYDNGISFIVYSDDEGKNWNTSEMNKNEDIQYIEFFNKDIGILYQIKDVAMSVAFGDIKVTNDGGKTWNVVNTGIDEAFMRDSKVKFFTKDLGYITMPYNGGNSCELYMTMDQGRNFNKVNVQQSVLEDEKLLWEEVYDYYNMPTLKDGVYYLEVGQGADGDYNGGDSIKYYSFTGFGWNNKEIEKKEREELSKKFNERVASRSDKIFLKDFENYKPENNNTNITQKEAEKIAEIGFEEAGTIGESGDKENQTLRIEEKVANNFFTMDYSCKLEAYSNIVRKCYVFTRENSLGNGSQIYIDVTTGLIIGGECFGD